MKAQHHVSDALRVSRRSKDFPLVILQSFQPVG
jgi:hypothetical protein